MLAQGAPLWVVSEVLGHASVAITKDVYGHLIGGEKQEATEAITDALFELPDQTDWVSVAALPVAQRVVRAGGFRCRFSYLVIPPRTRPA